MSNADIRGRFIWHELMTTDPDAAGSFYSKVLPWKTQPSGMPSYTLWVSGKTQTGGLMALPAESQSAPPHWLLYIGTPNVDSTAQDIERLGGKILKSPADIPNVGRFAVATDPQGAAFAIYTPASAGDGAPPQGTVGGFSWHELATSDPDAATNFYVELFGWTKDSVHDMGPPVGGYQILGHAGKQVGGVFKSPDASVPPNWLSYVQVADAAKAANAAKAGGGRVLNGPMEVPGGSWVAQLMDPQGGAFAVVEAAFLGEAARATGCADRVKIHAARIEGLKPWTAGTVTARALAELEQLLDWAAPFVGPDTVLLFLKGAKADEELTAAARVWTIVTERRRSITDSTGLILRLSHLERRVQT